MATRGKTALVVDDEEAIRYMFSKFLTRLGYATRSASGGWEALQVLEHQSFDLALVDLSMPGMSGLEVIRRCRPGHPDMCILVVSAVVDADTALHARELGADDYVTKPPKLEDLKQRLEGAMARRVQGEGAGEAADQGQPSRVDVTRDLVQQQIESFTQTLSDSQPSERRRGSPPGRDG